MLPPTERKSALHIHASAPERPEHVPQNMAASILNLNVGVLGHVDSGKTSLAKAISTIASTASFDKNPQSQERGITIDLGFSSFQITLPDPIGNFTTVNFTLVDCPGHASLVKTVIGGEIGQNSY